MNGQVVFQLRAPPLWSPWALGWVVGHLAALAWTLALAAPGDAEWHLPLGFLATEVPLRWTAAQVCTGLAASGAVGFVLWAALRGRLCASLELREDSLVLGGWLGRRARVRLADVYAIDVTSRFESRRLALGIRRRLPLRISEARFPRPRDLETLARGLREAIGALPDGGEHLAAIDARAAVATRLRAPPPFLLSLLAVLGVAFGLELAFDATGSYSRLAAMGAEVPDLFLRGEWFRVTTSALLHQDLGHLVSNAFYLVIFGRFVEAWLGGARTLTLAALSSLVVEFFEPVRLLLGVPGRLFANTGVSGVVFAILAAFVVVTLRHRRRLPAGTRCPFIRWAILLGLLVLEVGEPNPGHLAGFAAGLVLVYLLDPRPGASGSSRESGRRLRILAALLLGFHAAGIAAAARYAATTGPSAFLEEAKRQLDTGALQPPLANNLAFDLAIDRHAPQPLLEVALEAAEAVHGAAPHERAFADTVATLRHRLDDHDGAVRVQREVFLEHRDRLLAKRLARLEYARIQDSSRLQTAPETVGRTSSGGIRVILPEELAGGGFLHALVLTRQGLRALLQVEVGEGVESPLDLGIPVLAGLPAGELDIVVSWVHADPDWHPPGRWHSSLLALPELLRQTR